MLHVVFVFVGTQSHFVFVLQRLQISFSIECGLTSCASSYDGLSIDWVAYIACSEYAWQYLAVSIADLLRGAYGLDIPHLVEGYIVAEDVCNWLVAYCEEKSVDGYVVVLLIGFTLALHEVHAFYAVLTIEPCGIMLKEYIDVLCALDALLHDV